MNDHSRSGIPVFYASSNPSKAQNMRNWLRGTPFQVLTPADLLSFRDGRFSGASPLEVEETGSSVVENAVLKVRAYADLLRSLPEDHPFHGLPVLAHDTGLYIDGLPEERQPGIHVRRYYVPDPLDPSRTVERSMSDQEALAFYTGIAREAGGQVRAWYFRGAALQVDKELFTLEIDSPPMILLDSACRPYTEKGNPLDVSTIDPETGKYWCDLSAKERDAAYGHFGRRIAAFLEEHLL